MNKWLKQNLNIGVCITLLIGYAAGAAAAAVFKSDVDRLKAQMESLPEDISAIKATQSEQGKDITFIKNYITRK